MLPKAVLTQVNGTQRAACGPLPVVIGKCVQPAASTAAQQDRPSLTTLLPAARSRLASAAISFFLKPLTTVSLQPPGLALGGRLHGGHERRLAGGTPPALAPRALPTQIGVVDLDPASEPGFAGVALFHRGHQLVLHEPGGRLARAQPVGQLDRAHPALALGQMVDRQKPRGQR